MDDLFVAPNLDAASVLQANKAYHAALAKNYNAEQPHFRPENTALVSARLERYAAVYGRDLLVDLGCGTGFVVGLALPHFDRIVGVDITPEMTEQIDCSSGKVDVVMRTTDDTGLPDSVANVVSANSFLHHLYDVRPTLHEAFRILRPGGVLFAEEDPNFAFWDALSRFERADATIVQREIAAVRTAAADIESATGVASDVVAAAEFQKMVRGGFRAEELRAMLLEIGFRQANVYYYWFLGQGSVHHQQSPEAAQTVERYLQSVLPLSAHLFKYLRVEAVK